MSGEGQLPGLAFGYSGTRPPPQHKATALYHGWTLGSQITGLLDATAGRQCYFLPDTCHLLTPMHPALSLCPLPAGPTSRPMAFWSLSVPPAVPSLLSFLPSQLQ